MILPVILRKVPSWLWGLVAFLGASLGALWALRKMWTAEGRRQVQLSKQQAREEAQQQIIETTKDDELKEQALDAKEKTELDQHTDQANTKTREARKGVTLAEAVELARRGESEWKSEE